MAEREDGVVLGGFTSKEFRAKRTYPHMNPKPFVEFPAFRYDPETGEGRPFQHAEEVPDGWVDHPNKCKSQPEAVGEFEYQLPALDDMTKVDITKQLDKRKIPYNKSWKEDRLYALLEDHLNRGKAQ